MPRSKKIKNRSHKKRVNKKPLNLTRVFMATLIMFSIPLPLVFNSCSGSEFGEVDIDSRLKALKPIVLNKGHTHTQDTKVTVFLNGKFADEMYVTNDSTCSRGGSWEFYPKNKTVKKIWTLSKEKQEVSVYVKFRTKTKDSQNSNPDSVPEVVQESECYGDSIIHVKPHVVKEQTFNIKKQASADILFVIDNSQSMANEQKRLGEKMNGFISKLNSYNIDWNIAFTSTDKYRLSLNGNVDSSTNPALYLLGKKNSRFKYVSQDKTVKDNPSLLGKDVYVLKNQDLYYTDNKIRVDEQSILQDTILSLGLDGHGAEGGIKSLMYFLEHKNVYPQSDLLRENSHFIAIVLSDEDEAPSEGKQPINVEERAQLFSDLIDLKVRKLGKDKSFQFHSIVYTEDSPSCPLGTWDSQGSIYMALSQLNRPDVGILPATISSLCVPSYTTVLDNIAESIKDRTQKITLKCPIIDLNDNGNLKDEITITPQPETGFEINSEGTVITFEDILNPQDYKLDYKCSPGN